MEWWISDFKTGKLYKVDESGWIELPRQKVEDSTVKKYALRFVAQFGRIVNKVFSEIGFAGSWLILWASKRMTPEEWQRH